MKRKTLPYKKLATIYKNGLTLIKDNLLIDEGTARLVTMIEEEERKIISEHSSEG